VSTDGGTFTPFESATTATSATFNGASGHTYRFYSVATDNVGLIQPTPPAPQATATVPNSPTPTPTPTPTSTPTPTPAPLVAMTSVREIENKKHQVTEVIVTFSGGVNAAEADNPAIYRLVTAGTKGSFTAKNAKAIGLKSAVYDPVNHMVMLVPKKPFAVTKPVQLTVHGQPPSGLQDSSGRFIDGDHNATAGGDAIAVLSRAGAHVNYMPSGTTGRDVGGMMAIVDALFDSDALLGVTENPRRASVAR
jgi:hypothetical protein